MMGHQQVNQAALFYEFSLERHVPTDHLLRSIERFVELGELRRELAAFYSPMGRPSIAFAFTALVDWWQRRPLLQRVGAPNGPLLNLLIVIFILLIGFLGVYGLVAVEGMPALNRGIFPEILTPFSLRAFGAFYLCIALA